MSGHPEKALAEVCWLPLFLGSLFALRRLTLLKPTPAPTTDDLAVLASFFSNSLLSGGFGMAVGEVQPPGT